MKTFNIIDRARSTAGFGGHPVLMETVSENDALNDLTSAVDMCHGLAGVCDTHLLWLSNESRKKPAGRDALRFWKDDPKLPGELQYLFEELRPDIVHTHRPGELATVGLAARKAGVPHIIHSICGEIADPEKWQPGQFAAVADGLSALLIAPSEEAAEQLPRMAQIEIVPMGIDCKRYVPGDQARARRKIGLPAHPRIVGCCSPAHGLTPLLQTIFQMDGDVHLALFGQGRPGPTERGLIRRLGLEERVHVLGAWAKPELVFQAIDVYFHGPSGDCLPRPVLAAQACGKPAIACTPAPSNALCPQTGRLAPLQFMPTLRHSLRRALGSTEPQIARQFVLDNWNVEQAVDGYGALLRRLTKQPIRRAG